jgi:hypothetical protein
MAPRRTERSIRLAEFDIPVSAGVSLVSAQDHGNVRRHLKENRNQILPDMIAVEVGPGPYKGSWHVEVWECPDE